MTAVLLALALLFVARACAGWWRGRSSRRWDWVFTPARSGTHLLPERDGRHTLDADCVCGPVRYRVPRDGRPSLFVLVHRMDFERAGR